MAAEEASMEEAGVIAEVGWKIAAQWNDGTWRKFCTRCCRGVEPAIPFPPSDKCSAAVGQGGSVRVFVMAGGARRPSRGSTQAKKSGHENIRILRALLRL